jgi:hypothetical protein
MQPILLAVGLVSACVVLQSAGTVFLVHWLARMRPVIESPSAVRRASLLLRLFLWIVLLHVVQVGLWAVAYLWTGRLPDLETATYFSLVTYTTIGYGDVVLTPGWRLMAGIEGLTGILLVGWSTAFTFTVLNRMYENWRLLHEGVPPPP